MPRTRYPFRGPDRGPIIQSFIRCPDLQLGPIPPSVVHTYIRVPDHQPCAGSPSGAQTSNPKSRTVSVARTSIRGSDKLQSPRLSASHQKSFPQLRPRSQNPVLYHVPRLLSRVHTSNWGSDLHPGPRPSGWAKKYIPGLRPWANRRQESRKGEQEGKRTG